MESGRELRKRRYLPRGFEMDGKGQSYRAIRTTSQVSKQWVLQSGVRDDVLA